MMEFYPLKHTAKALFFVKSDKMIVNIAYEIKFTRKNQKVLANAVFDFFASELVISMSNC